MGFTVSGAGAGALAVFSFDPAAAVSFVYANTGNPPSVMSQTPAAQDAALTIDGMKISSPSNTLSNAMQPPSRV